MTRPLDGIDSGDGPTSRSHTTGVAAPVSWRKRWSGSLALHDVIALTYLTVVGLMVTLSPSGSTRDACLLRIVTSAAVVFTASVVARGCRELPSNFRRYAYRLALSWVVIESYLMLRDLLPLVRPDTVDAALLALDRAIFGFEPALWLERFNQRPIIEWFSFFYFSYFWINAAYLLVVLWVLKAGRITSEYAIGSLLVMCIGQLGYCAVPGYGPIRYLADQYQGPLDGGFFWGCVWSTVQSASAMKDIFPSLHTAMPTWLTLFAFTQARRDRRWRWPAIVTGFFSFNIIVSTMLLRWHYAVDVVAGLSLAFAVGLATPRLARWEASRRKQRQLAGVWEI